MFTHRVFQEGASCTCASLLYIYLYTPLQVCVTVQGCVGLCVCGLGWVEMAGCDQPLPLLMLFQARLKITHLPLPAETKVLPREFTPPVSTLLASHGAGCCFHPLLLPSTASVDLQSSVCGAGREGVSRSPAFIARPSLRERWRG